MLTLCNRKLWVFFYQRLRRCQNTSKWNQSVLVNKWNLYVVLVVVTSIRFVEVLHNI
jgi:hypothetical protein